MGRRLLGLVTLAVGGIRGLRRRVLHDVERSGFGIRLRGLLRWGLVRVRCCGRWLLRVRLGRLVGWLLDVRSRFIGWFLGVLVNRLVSFLDRFLDDDAAEAASSASGSVASVGATGAGSVSWWAGGMASSAASGAVATVSSSAGPAEGFDAPTTAGRGAAWAAAMAADA